MKIDKKNVIAELGKAYIDGLKFSELVVEMAVKKKDEPKLRKLLSALVKEGAIDRVGRGQYAVVSTDDADTHAPESSAGAADSLDASDDALSAMVVGRISIHPAGYGFVAADDGSDDVFVPAKFRGAALDGDRVRVSTWDGHKGIEGSVEAVVARGRAKLTGTLRKRGRTICLEPDDPRIANDYGHVSLESLAGGKVGVSVVVEITRYPTEQQRAITGKVVRVLGDPDDPRTEIEKILTCADIPTEFPSEASELAKRVPQSVQPEDFADRIDLRDRAFLTIDPETARDFDDALCIEKNPGGGHRVWVAVADVSHYVRPDDPLDREASIRGVSVYLPDRVVPMLPFELSSGICSLNPEVERCAMVVRLDFDAQGNRIGHGRPEEPAVPPVGFFAAAVIRSQGRLDYPGVAGALSGDFRGRRARYRQWAPQLRALDDLAQQMRKRRLSRGALELDIPEAKVLLDEDDPRLVRDVVQAKGDPEIRNAYQLVEEFMIAANEAVGAFFRTRDLTTVWRIHEKPKLARVEELSQLLASYGVDIKASEALTPLGMCKVLDALKDQTSGRALMFLVLRSLKQAVYSTDNRGHFGLASEEYLHFTSPIRRYPDLLVHRLLKFYLHQEGQASGGAGSMVPPVDSELQELAAAASGYERRALEAERETVSMYRAYMMRDRVGDVLAGRVSGVTNFGVFIEIEAPFVEGLIKLEALGDDFFDFDPLRMQLSGRMTGVSLSLGDPVKVEVVNVSVGRRQVDFRMVAGPRRRPKKAAGTSGKRAREKAKTPARGKAPARGKSTRSKTPGKKTRTTKKAAAAAKSRRKSPRRRK